MRPIIPVLLIIFLVIGALGGTWLYITGKARGNLDQALVALSETGISCQRGQVGYNPFGGTLNVQDVRCAFSVAGLQMELQAEEFAGNFSRRGGGTGYIESGAFRDLRLSGGELAENILITAEELALDRVHLNRFGPQSGEIEAMGAPINRMILSGLTIRGMRDDGDIQLETLDLGFGAADYINELTAHNLTLLAGPDSTTQRLESLYLKGIRLNSSDGAVLTAALLAPLDRLTAFYHALMRMRGFDETVEMSMTGVSLDFADQRLDLRRFRLSNESVSDPNQDRFRLELEGWRPLGAAALLVPERISGHLVLSSDTLNGRASLCAFIDHGEANQSRFIARFRVFPPSGQNPDRRQGLTRLLHMAQDSFTLKPRITLTAADLDISGRDVTQKIYDRIVMDHPMPNNALRAFVARINPTETSWERNAAALDAGVRQSGGISFRTRPEAGVDLLQLAEAMMRSRSTPEEQRAFEAGLRAVLRRMNTLVAAVEYGAENTPRACP